MKKYVAFNPIGHFYAVDDSEGYWTTFANGTEGGLWTKADGSADGSWEYDDESSSSGIWSFNNGTTGGQWISSEDDPMKRYVAINPVGVFHAIDDSSGYWTTYADGHPGGVWIKDDGSDHGVWIHDEGSENTGTWWNHD